MTPDDTTEILPFPKRPDDRLRLSLRALDAALAEQRAAMAGLRAELASLSTAVSGLDRSLRTYQGALGDTAAELAQAGAMARRLETTADAMQAIAQA